MSFFSNPCKCQCETSNVKTQMIVILKQRSNPENKRKHQKGENKHTSYKSDDWKLSSIAMQPKHLQTSRYNMFRACRQQNINNEDKQNNNYNIDMQIKSKGIKISKHLINKNKKSTQNKQYIIYKQIKIQEKQKKQSQLGKQREKQNKITEVLNYKKYEGYIPQYLQKRLFYQKKMNVEQQTERKTMKKIKNKNIYANQQKYKEQGKDRKEAKTGNLDSMATTKRSKKRDSLDIKKMEKQVKKEKQQWIQQEKEMQDKQKDKQECKYQGKQAEIQQNKQQNKQQDRQQNKQNKCKNLNKDYQSQEKRDLKRKERQEKVEEKDMNVYGEKEGRVKPLQKFTCEFAVPCHNNQINKINKSAQKQTFQQAILKKQIIGLKQILASLQFQQSNLIQLQAQLQNTFNKQFSSNKTLRCSINESCIVRQKQIKEIQQFVLLNKRNNVIQKKNRQEIKENQKKIGY